ncbi:MAG TPA: GTPase Era [Longimicrobiales bacterium]|nr:GTPase Era [Longimicrobiales bacterium]
METTTRAGHIALVGRPNVGKSTLLNAFVGEKLSIVTPRAQTTRETVTGILTTGDAQLVFVDTPGLLEPRYALQRAMRTWALEALADADVVLLLLDATRPDELPDAEALEALGGRRHALIVVINKTDAASDDDVASLAAWSRAELDLEPHRLSAAGGQGVDELLRALTERLPASPFLYPEDELAVQSVRFFVTELIRETIFEEYEQEVPYSTAVRIEEYREASDPVYIRATIYVERDSQKQILIGRGGERIKRLGAQARQKIESFVGERVYLDLWVKPLANWRRKVGTLQYLGYPVPRDDADGH